MIYFFAGHLELMQNPEQEEAMAQLIIKAYSKYPRLISFNDRKIIMYVINLKKKRT